METEKVLFCTGELDLLFTHIVSLVKPNSKVQTQARTYDLDVDRSVTAVQIRH